MQDVLEILRENLKKNEQTTLDKILMLIENIIPPKSLKQLAEEYSIYAGLRYTPNTIRTTKSVLKILLEHFGEETLLRTLNSKKLETFLLNRFQQSKYGAALLYRTLRSIFEKAKSWGYIPKNPFVEIRLPKIPNHKVLSISETDFQKILCKEQSWLLQILYQIAFNTGMRLGELLNCKWHWINLDERIITVKNDNTFTTKSKCERSIPMTDSLYQLLVDFKYKSGNSKEEDYLFQKCKGIKLNNDFVSKKFKKCVHSAGVNPKYHFHLLRASFASSLVNAGLSIYSVKELLGHSSVTTTEKHYATMNLDFLRESMCNIK